MSSPYAKRFCVRFMATQCYKITVEAGNKREALAKARRIWNRSGEARFTAFAGDTDGWEAWPD